MNPGTRNPASFKPRGHRLHRRSRRRSRRAYAGYSTRPRLSPIRIRRTRSRARPPHRRARAIASTSWQSLPFTHDSRRGPQRCDRHGPHQIDRQPPAPHRHQRRHRVDDRGEQRAHRTAVLKLRIPRAFGHRGRDVARHLAHEERIDVIARLAQPSSTRNPRSPTIARCATDESTACSTRWSTAGPCSSRPRATKSSCSTPPDPWSGTPSPTAATSSHSPQTLRGAHPAVEADAIRGDVTTFLAELEGAGLVTQE